MTTPNPQQQRRAWMEHQLALFATHFGATLVGPPIHTDRHHSVGARVSTARGTAHATGNTDAWLRVVCADPEWANSNSYLAGNLTANNIRDVPRPSISQWHEWKDNGYTLRGELSTYIADQPISREMVLTAEPNLTDTWLDHLRAALDTLTDHPTPPAGLDPDDLNNGIQAFFGITIDTSAIAWTTAHCDLHWGNLTAPNLYLLDWEIWGKAPAGYDAATLHCTSLLAPTAARRVHDTLNHHLDNHAGQIATLAAAVRFLRLADEGDYLSLAQPLRQHAQAIATTHAAGRS